MDPLILTPPAHPFTASPLIPGSKSITNRALVLAALCSGDHPITLRGVLFADDTRQMLGALDALRFPIRINESARTVILTPTPAPLGSDPVTLQCGNSGTTIRFLAAMLAFDPAPRPAMTLDGVPRMRQRPIAELVDALRAAGASIDYLGQPGFPPIRINAISAPSAQPAPIRFQNVKSSQYISAILMAAPITPHGLALELLGPVTSEPYVTMTHRMMEQFGVSVSADHGPQVQTIAIPPGRYAGPAGRDYLIEPDASNASYFWVAAALVPGSSITVAGLSTNSLQGDVAVTDVLGQMGARVSRGENAITVAGPPAGRSLRAVDLDMNHIPDMVQTIAVAALFAEGTTTLRNIPNLRLKETDRLAALETELRKFNATVTTTPDSVTITPPRQFPTTLISIGTYDDHRMAMSFALATLRLPNVQIENPGCVAKTYPDFFRDFTAATRPQTA